MMILELLEDGFFAAIAAVGFAIISNPPRRSLFVSALLAAIGHSIRYFLMHFDSFSLSISQASFFASLSIGCLSVFFAKRLAVPAEVFAFPSLLPMIPGMFAYHTLQAISVYMVCKTEADQLHYFNLFYSNGTTTIFILAALVVGVAIPTFLFRRFAFSVTRGNNGKN